MDKRKRVLNCDKVINQQWVDKQTTHNNYLFNCGLYEFKPKESSKFVPRIENPFRHSLKIS